MAIKTYRPITPTLRFKSTVANDDLTTNRPHKPLTKIKQRTGGRRNAGDITMWHRGGGHKRKIRTIDFKRDKSGVPATVATIGQVGNTDHENISIGKAGRKRWMGIKPTNRGVVMNPVDHPHGGGEGKTSGGRHPVTPWGQPTRGYKTRNNKRTDKFIVQRRSK